MKQFGDENGFGQHCRNHAPEGCDVFFVFDRPVDTVDPACGGTLPVTNGRLVALPVRARTSDTLDARYYEGFFWSQHFSAIDAGGLTVRGLSSPVTLACHAESGRALPDVLMPGMHYEGVVVLDIPADATALEFTAQTVTWWFALT
ncbi:hypothetical protein DW322_16995 [Rhodococcus rhodnii]|uniref:Uncharacterized protein n=2 Tax=Rhodococcus rhodnii TaxID=38312 RepID=R7WME9_9NOCA|nr:hypothetical protein [Rhodococcus rhodnii]EOM76482.1 hypothetical protein Rrhod_2278 [Rhodococcus rhodnii LMG 5362]TXG91587.1 hypothetical protein DW322_16995 [Rhodococcus rhodnii]